VGGNSKGMGGGEMIVIDAEISEEDAERLRDGEGTEYPLRETVFIKTVGGYINMFEVMMLAFNRFGRKFRISIEGLSEDTEIKPNKISAAFMNDAIRGS
jgi:hypothetical protein